MSAEIDWTKTGVVVAIVVGVVIIVLMIVIPILQSAAARRNIRAASDREERIALASAATRLTAQLHPKAGIGAAQPPNPPVIVQNEGSPVWLHEVRLSWRWSASQETSWEADNEACPPWDSRASLPLLVGEKRKSEWAWPGSQPDQQRQILGRIRVRASITEDGPVEWQEVNGDQVGWQYD